MQIAYYQKFVDEHSKNQLKQALVAYDRTLLVADNRRCEPKKFGGPGARARYQVRESGTHVTLQELTWSTEILPLRVFCFWRYERKRISMRWALHRWRKKGAVSVSAFN